MSETQLDALVVGTGFGGIYACYSLRKLGLEFACIDNASDVGGTWYWNTYPGAMSDTHSHLYRFSFDEEDYKTYPWTHNYVHQPEILAYLKHVVERHDLRKYIQFKTEMLSATFDENTGLWRVNTSTGQVFVVRYLITAMGLLSQAVFPDIAGLQDFKGTMVHTSAWKDDLDLRGRRVAIIGNGSSGVQVVTSIASQVGSLTSFIRTPQYVVPAGLREFTTEQRNELNSNFDALWQSVWHSAVGFGFKESTRSFADATPEEREQVFEQLWKDGNGFWFMLGGFYDLTTNVEANQYAGEFIRRKIRQTVHDAEKARILSPHDFYARRPVCAVDYYEQFNRDNVDVVSLQENPISTVTERGIVTGDGVEREFDVIILATGFDALDGNYTRLHIAGRRGHTVRDHWAQTVTSFCGISLSGFPNLFMVLGPQSAFTNNPPTIETQVEFIMALITRAEALRSDDDAAAGAKGVVEVTPEAEAEWAQKCEDSAADSLLHKASSWLFGSNVPGKPYATRFFFPGMLAYRQHLQKSIESCNAFTFE